MMDDPAKSICGEQGGTGRSAGNRTGKTDQPGAGRDRQISREQTREQDTEIN